MAGENQDKPKIHIDDDWKAQAQREKERLAQEVEAKKSQPAQAPTPAAVGSEAPTATSAGQARELPPASFATLVSTLVTQVLFALGGIEDPRTKRRYVDLPLAKHHIDMLGVVEAKTRGNLSPEEQQMLDQALYETRMNYVDVAQRMTQI